jgi:hypothetical protein
MIEIYPQMNICYTQCREKELLRSIYLHMNSLVSVYVVIRISLHNNTRKIGSVDQDQD